MPSGADAAGAAHPQRRYARSLNRRYGLFAAAFLLFVVGMAFAEQLGLPRGWIGGTFLLATVAIYASVGFACRTTDEAEYFVAGRRVPAMYNGMATAADWMSAASFIGTAGVLYLHGVAGLAYILGWTGGYCLLALLLVPYLRRSGQFTIPDFLGARYGGNGLRVIGALAVMMVSFIYLVVQIYGVGLITSHLTGFGFELGVLVGLGGVLVCSFLGGMRAVTWTQVAQYIVLIVAYLVPLMWLSMKQTGDPLPLLDYAQQLREIDRREQQLMADPAERDVRQRLQLRAAEAQRKLLDVPTALAEDIKAQAAEVAELRAANAPLAKIQRAERELTLLPRTPAQAQRQYELDRDSALAHTRPLAGMPPQTLPYATGDPDGDPAARKRFDAARINFIALMLCLMVGTAAMPHVLLRYQTTPTVSQARRSVAWSLLFIIMLYLAAPALAVMVKYEVLHQIVGLSIEKLPGWVYRWAKLDPHLVTVRDINGDGILQLGELWLGGDVIVLAAPEIGGLPYFATALVAAGGLAAALSTADGLLITIASAASHDLYFRILRPASPVLQRVLMSKLLVMVVALCAAAVASLNITNILLFVAAAFSLAGAAFFPALVAGIFWRRATRAGAIAGVLAGLGVCLYYMIVTVPLLRQFFGITRPLAESQWFGVEPVGAGIFGVPAGALVLVVVSLLSPRPGPEQLALVDRLRVPATGER